MKKLLIILLGLVASCTKPSIEESPKPIEKQYSILGKWVNGDFKTVSSYSYEFLDSVFLYHQWSDWSKDTNSIQTGSYVYKNDTLYTTRLLMNKDSSFRFVTRRDYCKILNDSTLKLVSNYYKKIK